MSTDRELPVVAWYSEPINDHAAATASLSQAKERIAELETKLRDPTTVHVALMRGEIAKPPIRDTLHAYGEDALGKWDRAEAAEARLRVLEEALTDMLAGWKYIRSFHGDLSGVGWNRAQDKAEAALAQNRLSHDQSTTGAEKDPC